MRNVAFAVIGGLIAALFFSAFRAGGLGAIILFWMAQLPLFLPGLGLGIWEALLAGAVGTGAVAWAISPAYAVTFLVVTALPVEAVVILALGRFGRKTPPVSPGVMILVLAGLGLAAFGVAVVAMHQVPGGLEGAIGRMLDAEIAALRRMGLVQSSETVPTAALAAWFPGLVAVSWLSVSAINGILAQGVLARFGQNRWKSPGIASLDLPRWSSLVFLAAVLAASFGKGQVAFIGANVALISALPLSFGGLAVVHSVAARLAMPGMVLFWFYATSLLLGWSVPLVVVLGVIEQWFGLKRRFATKPDRRRMRDG
jgi:hypothetical protein